MSKALLCVKCYDGHRDGEVPVLFVTNRDIAALSIQDERGRHVGSVYEVSDLRALAHAILRAIGDEPGGGSEPPVPNL